MEKRIEDLDKSMKRSNDKQLKIEHELCLKVSEDEFLIFSWILYDCLNGNSLLAHKLLEFLMEIHICGMGKL